MAILNMPLGASMMAPGILSSLEQEEERKRQAALQSGALTPAMQAPQPSPGILEAPGNLQSTTAMTPPQAGMSNLVGQKSRAIRPEGPPPMEGLNEGPLASGIPDMTKTPVETPKVEATPKKRNFAASEEFFQGLLRGGAAMLSGGDLGDAFGAMADATERFNQRGRLKYTRDGAFEIGTDEDGRVVSTRKLDDIAAYQDRITPYQERTLAQGDKQQDLAEARFIWDVDRDGRDYLRLARNDEFDQSFKLRELANTEAQTAYNMQIAGTNAAVNAAQAGFTVPSGSPLDPGMGVGMPGGQGDIYGSVLTKLESNNNPNAAAPTSNARGLHQFIPSTWLSTVRKARPAWAQGMSEQQILQQRFNPERSAQMEAVLRQENMQALQQVGAAPTVGNLYGMHHFGPRGGTRFAQASGDTPMEQILTPEQLNANAYLKGKTKNQVLQNWANRAGVSPAVFNTVNGAPAQNLGPSPVQRAAQAGIPTLQRDPNSPKNQTGPVETTREDRVRVSKAGEMARDGAAVLRDFDRLENAIANYKGGPDTEFWDDAVSVDKDDSWFGKGFAATVGAGARAVGLRDPERLKYRKELQEIAQAGVNAGLRLNNGVQTEGDAIRESLVNVGPDKTRDQNIAIARRGRITATLAIEEPRAMNQWISTYGSLNAAAADGTTFEDYWQARQREITNQVNQMYQQRFYPNNSVGNNPANRQLQGAASGNRTAPATTTGGWQVQR